MGHTIFSHRADEGMLFLSTVQLRQYQFDPHTLLICQTKLMSRAALSLSLSPDFSLTLSPFLTTHASYIKAECDRHPGL